MRNGCAVNSDEDGDDDDDDGIGDDDENAYFSWLQYTVEKISPPSCSSSVSTVFSTIFYIIVVFILFVLRLRVVVCGSNDSDKLTPTM